MRKAYRFTRYVQAIAAVVSLPYRSCNATQSIVIDPTAKDSDEESSEYESSEEAASDSEDLAELERMEHEHEHRSEGGGGGQKEEDKEDKEKEGSASLSAENQTQSLVSKVCTARVGHAGRKVASISTAVVPMVQAGRGVAFDAVDVRGNRLHSPLFYPGQDTCTVGEGCS